ARGTDAAAILRLADEFSQVARILYVVAQREVIIGVELVIDSGKAVVVVLGLQNPLKIRQGCARAVFRLKRTALRREAEIFFCGIEVRDACAHIGSVGGRCAAAVPLVVREVERLVFYDRAAKSTAELVFAYGVRQGRWLQVGTRVGSAVLQVIVN